MKRDPPLPLLSLRASWCVFALALASCVTYFATSHGVRGQIAFVAKMLAKILEKVGVGA
jgi:hypothetical protein